MLVFWLQSMLGKHPNVVECLGYVDDGTTVDAEGDGALPMLALEFVERGSLDSLLNKADTDLNEAARLGLSADVACGLSTIHCGGILHNDIAARNVLVTSSNVVCGA